MIVYNTLKKPDSEPLRGVRVSAVLSWDESSVAAVRNEENDFVVDAEAMATTNLDGYWELDLFTNASLSPEGSIYRITETLTSTNVNVYYVSLSNVEGPVWVGDILVSKPEWES